MFRLVRLFLLTSADPDDAAGNADVCAIDQQVVGDEGAGAGA